MINKFYYHMPTEIFFGPGVSKNNLNQLLSGNNVLIISDPFLYQNGIAQQIGESLKGKNVHYFSEIEPNPSCETVDKAAEIARKIKADCIIGLGGGSSLDVSKITACLAGETGSIYDYYAGGKRQFTQRKAVLVCIPTTAGTGSEVTNVGVYTDKKTETKMPMVHEFFWADATLIDPQLTYTLPPAVTASTGMDAFCHAVEAYWNQDSQPITDWVAMGAMKLILENIKCAYDNPENQEARGNMMLASLTAGIAFSQTRTTGIHALSFPLTSEFGVSHGTACAITLPAFIRLSVQQKQEKMEQLAAFLGLVSVEDMADSIETLMRSMNMPVRLSQLGIRQENLEHIAQVGMNAAIIHLTPAHMDQESVLQLLRSIL